MTDEIQRIADIGRPGWLEGYDPKAPGGITGFRLLQELFLGLQEDHDTLTAGLRRIDTSGDLTPTGKVREKARLASEARTKLNKRRETFEIAKRQIAKKRAEATPSEAELSDGDKVMMVSIWSELPRDSFRVQTLHGEALEKGDILTARAIEALPFFFEGALEPDTVKQLKLKRIGESLDPVARVTIERDEEAIKETESAIAFFETTFTDAEQAAENLES